MYEPKDLNSYDIDALEIFEEELNQFLTIPYFILNPIKLIKNKTDGCVIVKKAILPIISRHGTKFLPEAIDDVYAWEMLWYKVKVFLQFGLQLFAAVIILNLLLNI